MLKTGKKWISLACVTALVAVLGVVRLPSAEADELVNLALHKSVTASNTADYCSAGAVVDGKVQQDRWDEDIPEDSDERYLAYLWTPGTKNANEFVTINLGARQTISNVKIQYAQYGHDATYKTDGIAVYDAVPKTISVYVSPNGTDWTRVVEKSANVPTAGAVFNHEFFTYEFTQTEAQFVKITNEDGNQGPWHNPAGDTAGASGLQITEIEVYGQPAPAPTGNLALGKTVSASNTADYCTADGVVDGKLQQDRWDEGIPEDSDEQYLAYLWTPGTKSANEYITIDLGEALPVSVVKIQYAQYGHDATYKTDGIAVYDAVPVTMSVYVSSNGTDWTRVVDKSDNVPSSGTEFNHEFFSYVFEQVQARYVKVTNEDGNQGPWHTPMGDPSGLQITEIEIYSNAAVEESYLNKAEDWELDEEIEVSGNTETNGAFWNEDMNVLEFGSAVAGYAATVDEFGSQTIEFDFTPTFLEPNDVTDMAWVGFALRAASLNAIWNDANRGYLIVVKEDVIEVQRWVDGRPELLNMDIPNDGVIEIGKTHRIKLSTVLTADQVAINMYVDGVLVVDETDRSEDRIQTKGKFLVNGLGGFTGTLSSFAVSGDDDPELPGGGTTTAPSGNTTTKDGGTATTGEDTSNTNPNSGADNNPDTGNMSGIPALFLMVMGVSVIVAVKARKNKEGA